MHARVERAQPALAPSVRRSARRGECDLLVLRHGASPSRASAEDGAARVERREKRVHVHCSLASAIRAVPNRERGGAVEKRTYAHFC